MTTLNNQDKTPTPPKEIFNALEYCNDDLFKMLSFGRPHKSAAEAEFIKHFILPLDPEVDGFGNFIVKIGDTPLMWSCHVDTIHRNPINGQGLVHWNGYVGLRKRKPGRVLGGDDTAGVWLMIEMIKKNKPGLYVFHRGEEKGGLGSKWRAENAKDAVKDINFCIALDRKGTKDVIVRQSVGKCCSDEFADSLIGQLEVSKGAMGWKKDPTGTFTDSASYIKQIAECTNLSVGYEQAHSAEERLDVVFLHYLLDRLLLIDPEKLVVKRDPTAVVTTSYYGGTHSAYGYWDGNKWISYDNKTSVRRGVTYNNTSHKPTKTKEPDDATTDDSRLQTLEELVRDYPTIVAAMLKDYGIDEKLLRETIIAYGFDPDA